MFPSVSHRAHFSVLFSSFWTLPSLLFDWNSFCLQPAFCWEDNNNNSGICTVQNLVQRDYCNALYTQIQRNLPSPSTHTHTHTHTYTHTKVWILIDWLINDCLYSTILCSRADSLHSHVILHEWLAFHSAFLNIHRSGVLTVLAGLVPRETAAVSAQVLCTPYVRCMRV